MTGFDQTQSDSPLKVQTPEGIEFVIYPAGFLIRACAWAIDSCIKGALVLAVLIATVVLGDALGMWFTLIAVFLLDWFYYTAFEVFWRGQSPGKRFMGIRVVRSDGSPVNPGASFLRNLLRFVDTFMSLNLIAFICMLASPAFRRIGDWAADTLVVYTADARFSGRFIAGARRQSAPTFADAPLVSPSRTLDYEEKQAVLAFARRYPLLSKERADEIAASWAGELGGAGNEVSASAYLLGIAHSIGGGAQ